MDTLAPKKRTWTRRDTSLTPPRKPSEARKSKENIIITEADTKRVYFVGNGSVCKLLGISPSQLVRDKKRLMFGNIPEGVTDYSFDNVAFHIQNFRPKFNSPRGQGQTKRDLEFWTAREKKLKVYKEENGLIPTQSAAYIASNAIAMLYRAISEGFQHSIDYSDDERQRILADIEKFAQGFQKSEAELHRTLVAIND